MANKEIEAVVLSTVNRLHDSEYIQVEWVTKKNTIRRGWVFYSGDSEFSPGDVVVFLKENREIVANLGPDPNGEIPEAEDDAEEIDSAVSEFRDQLENITAQQFITEEEQ